MAAQNSGWSELTGPLMDVRTDRTRLALLRAAETLFLERGVEAVSLREIAQEAAQKNPSAASYHFVDKRGLVDALLSRHATSIQAGWLATLAHLDAQGHAPTLEELAGLLVRPIVAKLDDPDGGRAYLAVSAELTTSRAFPLLDTMAARGEGALELARRMMALIGGSDPALLSLRMMRLASVIYVSIHDYAALASRGLVVAREAFVEDLVATIIALVRAASAGEPPQRPRPKKSPARRAPPKRSR